MSNEANPPDNPWQPPSPPSGMSPVAPSELSVPAPRVRPGGLTAICVMGIVMGGMEVITTVGSQLFASQAQRFAVGIQPNQAAAELQDEMIAKALEINDRYTWLTLPLVLVKLVVEAALVAGAIMALGLKPAGRTCFLGALLAAAVVEMVQAVPTVMAQYETHAVMREIIAERTQQGAQEPNNPPSDIEQLMSIGFSAAVIVMLIMALVWLAVKITYYTIGFFYLKKPQVVALFAAPPADGSPAR